MKQMKTPICLAALDVQVSRRVSEVARGDNSTARMCPASNVFESKGRQELSFFRAI